jgi:hypothetical protein
MMRRYFPVEPVMIDQEKLLFSSISRIRFKVFQGK